MVKRRRSRSWRRTKVRREEPTSPPSPAYRSRNPTSPDDPPARTPPRCWHDHEGCAPTAAPCTRLFRAHATPAGLLPQSRPATPKLARVVPHAIGRPNRAIGGAAPLHGRPRAGRAHRQHARILGPRSHERGRFALMPRRDRLPQGAYLSQLEALQVPGRPPVLVEEPVRNDRPVDPPISLRVGRLRIVGRRRQLGLSVGRPVSTASAVESRRSAKPSWPNARNTELM